MCFLICLVLGVGSILIVITAHNDPAFSDYIPQTLAAGIIFLVLAFVAKNKNWD